MPIYVLSHVEFIGLKLRLCKKMTNIRYVTVMMMLLLEKVIESHSQLVSLQSPLVGTAFGWWSGKKLVFGCDSTFCVEIVCFLFKRFVTYLLFTSRFSYKVF